MAGPGGLPILGVALPQFSAEPGPALAACRDAHRLGFGGAFVFDHLWPLGAPGRPALEGEATQVQMRKTIESVERNIREAQLGDRTRVGDLRSIAL